MKILVAPDKFKGSLTAHEVCEAIQEGVLRFDRSFNIQKVPLADGGEGSLDILQQHLELKEVSLPVNDPLGRTVEASYMMSEEAAYVEMAQASGLDLLEAEERNCLHTSSYGTGQLILDAYQRGIRKIFLFVGGSATNDGGIGVLDALGIHPLGPQGRLSSIGKSLGQITGFEESQQKAHGLNFRVICDVLNPLYGPDGAAYVYGPQKGADKEAVVLLDRGLQNLANVVWESKKIRIDDFEGAGAAGGVAAGLKAYFDIRIQSGFEAISEMTGLFDKLSKSDLVITGEGKFDRQTLQGKVVKGVYDLCQQSGKKLAVICGMLELDPKTISSLDIWKISSLVDQGTTLDQAQKNAYELVSQRAYELFQEKSS